MLLNLQKSIKDFLISEKDEERHRNKNIVVFVKKGISVDKFKDHCHLTGNYKGTAHNKGIVNDTREQPKFLPLAFLNFINFHSHLF